MLLGYFGMGGVSGGYMLIEILDHREKLVGELRQVDNRLLRLLKTGRVRPGRGGMHERQMVTCIAYVDKYNLIQFCCMSVT